MKNLQKSAMFLNICDRSAAWGTSPTFLHNTFKVKLGPRQSYIPNNSALCLHFVAGIGFCEKCVLSY